MADSKPKICVKADVLKLDAGGAVIVFHMADGTRATHAFTQAELRQMHAQLGEALFKRGR